MANLTGDFDVIAQLSVPAINRILAGMHAVERFPHSLSMRVDDTTRNGRGKWPTVIGVRDIFGDATTDHSSIRDPRPINLGNFFPGSAESAAVGALGAVANIDVGDFQVEPIDATHFKGKAQVQLFPPTIEIADSTGTRVAVKIEMIARYLPDMGTPQLPQFIRGYIGIAGDVNQISSQAGNILSVDIKASTATITFTPKWSSAPLTAQDKAGITNLIRNALRTSFVPSTATIEAGLQIRFKTMSGPQEAVSVLFDKLGTPDDPDASTEGETPGDPNSATEVFIRPGDGFALGVGADYARALFKPKIKGILEREIDPIRIPINLVLTTIHVTYRIKLTQVTLEFAPGKMVLVVDGNATTSNAVAPNFSFRMRQDLTLSVFGSTAILVVGNFTVTSGTWGVSAVLSLLRGRFAAIRDEEFEASNIQTMVMQSFDAEKNFGTLLGSLLTPANQSAAAAPLGFTVPYLSAEIRNNGIVLHGMINLESWSAPRVEFEPISAAQDPGMPPLPGTVISGPDYTALRSWIPGGTIQKYEWHKENAPGYTDENRFILFDQGPVISSAMTRSARPIPGYSPMCLTVYGTSISAYGPFSEYPLSMTSCGYRSFPFDDLLISSGALAPMIALTRKGASGRAEVIGHAVPQRANPRAQSPNIVVFFPGEESADTLPDLSRAVRESERADAEVAIVVATRPSQVERLPFSEDVTYIDDDDALRRRLGVAPNATSTVIVSPDGKTVWKEEGVPQVESLAAALRKTLSRTEMSKPSMHTASVRIGTLAPDFLFEAAPGQILSLRKTQGRPVEVVFYRKSSAASVNAVRSAGSEGHLVIAVTDNQEKNDELTGAVVVLDRSGQIARAYGVSMWPTQFSIDKAGILRRVTYGHLSKGEKSRV